MPDSAAADGSRALPFWFAQSATYTLNPLGAKVFPYCATPVSGTDLVCTKGSYFGATEVSCDLPAGEYGANLHVGLSNDGGMSRGSAVAAGVTEMMLELDGAPTPPSPPETTPSISSAPPLRRVAIERERLFPARGGHTPPPGGAEFAESGPGRPEALRAARGATERASGGGVQAPRTWSWRPPPTGGCCRR